jgi:hypothetical protein
LRFEIAFHFAGAAFEVLGMASLIIKIYAQHFLKKLDINPEFDPLETDCHQLEMQLRGFILYEYTSVDVQCDLLTVTKSQDP